MSNPIEHANSYFGECPSVVREYIHLKTKSIIYDDPTLVDQITNKLSEFWYVFMKQIENSVLMGVLGGSFHGDIFAIKTKVESILNRIKCKVGHAEGHGFTHDSTICEGCDKGYECYPSVEETVRNFIINQSQYYTVNNIKFTLVYRDTYLDKLIPDKLRCYGNTVSPKNFIENFCTLMSDEKAVKMYDAIECLNTGYREETLAAIRRGEYPVTAK